MRGLGRLALGFSILALVSGCGSSDDETAETLGPIPIEPVRLTTEVTLAPKATPQEPSTDLNPSDPAARKTMLADGWGALVEMPGEAHATRPPPGQTPPAAGASPKRLARFVHMPDLQLADDESPTRLALFDGAAPAATDSAFRPHDVDMCNIVNAAVKSVNELHEKEPFDFLLLGGDNADSAQQNELDWVFSILNGKSEVECDSGADDNPIAGGKNDGKDPFEAPGLAMPWYWVTGNHDILIQGNLPVTPAKQAEAVGSVAVGGARDWSQPGGPLVKEVVPDELRKPLVRKDVMSAVVAAGGHGVGPDQVASGKGIYTFDVDGTPLRFLILDTACETGGSSGMIRQGDVDTVIKPALDQAKTENKLVVLASHHATSSLGNGVGLGGKEQPDAVVQADWEAFIGGYDNVVFSIVGHSHRNRMKWIAPTGGHGWWEVMTSALADFPNQLRVIEIWDQDNGWLMLRGTNVDFSTMGDRAALDGRTLATLDYVSGWVDEGLGAVEDRNAEIWIPKP